MNLKLPMLFYMIFNLLIYKFIIQVPLLHVLLNMYTLIYFVYSSMKIVKITKYSDFNISYILY